MFIAGPGVLSRSSQLLKKHEHAFIMKYLFDEWNNLNEKLEQNRIFLFLDYDDPEVVIDLINRMAAVYPERSLREQQAFISKLRTLKTMAEDGEVRDQAAEVLASLS